MYILTKKTNKHVRSRVPLAQAFFPPPQAFFPPPHGGLKKTHKISCFICQFWGMLGYTLGLNFVIPVLAVKEQSKGEPPTDPNWTPWLELVECLKEIRTPLLVPGSGQPPEQVHGWPH